MPCANQLWNYFPHYSAHDTTIPQRYRWTDELPWHSALCVASRVKKLYTQRRTLNIINNTKSMFIDLSSMHKTSSSTECGYWLVSEASISTMACQIAGLHSVSL